MSERINKKTKTTEHFMKVNKECRCDCKHCDVKDLCDKCSYLYSKRVQKDTNVKECIVEKYNAVYNIRLYYSYLNQLAALNIDKQAIKILMEHATGDDLKIYKRHLSQNLKEQNNVEIKISEIQTQLNKVVGIFLLNNVYEDYGSYNEQYNLPRREYL